MTESIRELDTVVLLRDLPDAGLYAGDVGAVVHLHGPFAFEVEFVSPTGRTVALATLTTSDVRIARDDGPAPRAAGGRACVNRRRPSLFRTPSEHRCAELVP